MKLGTLSATYESNGDPAAINEHDDNKGGMSYGAYQFYSGSGTVQGFIEWLPPSSSLEFTGLAPCTPAFNEAWRTMAAKDHDGFLEKQWSYAKAKYYDVAMEKLGTSVPMSDTMKNIVWSAAIQYGPYRVSSLFNEAKLLVGFKDGDDEALLISAIYYVRATPSWNKGYPRMLYRMALECKDALSQ